MYCLCSLLPLWIALDDFAMAKSKKYVYSTYYVYAAHHFNSHTNHNQNKKAHRNGIKRPTSHRSVSMKGVRVICVYLP